MAIEYSYPPGIPISPAKIEINKQNAVNKVSFKLNLPVRIFLAYTGSIFSQVR